MAWERMAMAFVIVVAVGCTSSATGTVEPAAQASPIETAAADWQEAGIDSYVVTVIQTNQTLEGGCRWVTEVHGADVHSRWSSNFDNDCGEWDVSIPALHQEIVERTAEVEANGGTLDVAWADTGVPTSIESDPRYAGSAKLPLVVEFENLTGKTSIRTELADARAQWFDAESRNYSLTLSEARNYWFAGCRWSSAITDGVVTEASVDPASTSSYCAPVEWNVEMLYDRISRWADTIDQFSDPAWGEHTLTATFGEHGVPVALNFDLANGNDEESTLRVNFAPLP